MDKILSFTNGMNFEDFLHDEKTKDAVIRNFEIIGEAANKIPENIKSKYNQVPWMEMYGLRNIVSHEYFGIDFELIWKIILDQLPENKNDVEQILILETLAEE